MTVTVHAEKNMNSSQQQQLDVVSLRQITLAAPSLVLYCDRCQSYATEAVQHDKYKWAVTLICKDCNLLWFVCTTCEAQKTAKKTDRALYHHNRNFHLNDAITIIDSASSQRDLLNCNIDEGGTSLRRRRIGSQALTTLGTAPQFDMLGKHNKQYFYNQHMLNLGNAYLVSQAYFKLDSVVADVLQDEVTMHHGIACLVSTLTKGQNAMVAEVLHNVVKVLGRKSIQMKESTWETKVPMSYSDIQKWYCKGRYAVLQNLPRPGVTMVGEHAYVSLTDCIADLLAHGFEGDNIGPVARGEPITMISQTARAQRILNNKNMVYPNDADDVLTLFLIEWSDGFEPSLSIKSNRGSCWLKTVTISPTPSKLHSFTNTYPIALGMDGESHNAIEEAFEKELRFLRNGEGHSFYHGGLKRNVKVYVELFASLQDQPERRKANYIMLGRSTYTAQFGLSMDFAAVASRIPACKNCLQQLLSHEETRIPGTCHECVSWDTDACSGLLDFDPPSGYPAELIPQSGKLSPTRITYEGMMNAVKAAHEGLVNGGWLVQSMTVML